MAFHSRVDIWECSVQELRSRSIDPTCRPLNPSSTDQSRDFSRCSSISLVASGKCSANVLTSGEEEFNEFYQIQFTKHMKREKLAQRTRYEWGLGGAIV